jgi:hypothetical protein
MNHTIDTSTVRTTSGADMRRPLVLALIALLATELFHMAATLANDGEPKAHHAQLGPPLHICAVVVTIGLIVWVMRRGAHGPALTAAIGAAVIFAAVTYHMLPIESDFNNRFWDSADPATLAQKWSVVAGIVASAACVVAGLRAHRVRAR